METGLVGEERGSLFSDKLARLRNGRDLLTSLRTTPGTARKAGINVNADGKSRTAFELLSYPDVKVADVERLWPEIADIAPAAMEQLVTDAQYAVYLDRQKADIEAVKRDEQRDIPDWLDYDTIPGLSMEIRQKLQSFTPQTIAQAQAIDGMTPAAVTLLLSVIRRGGLSKAS